MHSSGQHHPGEIGFQGFLFRSDTAAVLLRQDAGDNKEGCDASPPTTRQKAKGRQAKGKGKRQRHNRHGQRQYSRTRSSSPLEDLYQSGRSVQAHQQLAGAQVRRRDGGDVVQHVQLMYVLEGHLLPELQVNQMQSLLGGQLVLTQQLHQERSEPCRQRLTRDASAILECQCAALTAEPRSTNNA